MSPLTIQADDVAKAFGPHRAVAGVSLQVRAGDLVALVGPSGSGKTTVLRLVAGFEVPDAGRVSIAGHAVAGNGVWVEPHERRIGMVFQDGALFPHLSVRANVAFGDASADRVGECLELVGLAGRAGSFPHELSGGERQRIALARALAPEPAVVLLDEPFAALDEGLRVSLRQDVADILRAAGASALLVTHNQQEALSLADVVAVMRAGRIEQVGPPEEVYRRPASRWVAEFLGDADVLDGVASDGTVRCPLGRFPANGAPSGPVEVVLRPEDLTITPDADPGEGRHAGARVVGRSYFGHDQLVVLELDGGLRVRSRRPGSARWRPGERVRVAVTGPVAVFAPA